MSFNTEENTSIEVGDKAPNFTLYTPQGGKIKLSDTKGKIVYLDFWASWCKSCRKDHKKLVKLYRKYHDTTFVGKSTFFGTRKTKGFEVFQVSLDKNKEHWKSAIKKDHLIWNYHGSDLKGFKSEVAKKYSVGSLPMSFLINANGIVIAKNLKSDRLKRELEKMKVSKN